MFEGVVSRNILNCHLQTLSVWKSLKFVVWERVKYQDYFRQLYTRRMAARRRQFLKVVMLDIRLPPDSQQYHQYIEDLIKLCQLPPEHRLDVRTRSFSE